MRRWVFAIITILSAAMLLWSLNLWAKSYDRGKGGCVSADHIWPLGGGSVVTLGGNDGSVYVHFYTGRDWVRNATENCRYAFLGVVYNVIWDPTGTYGPKGFVVSRYLAAPGWMPTLAFASLPTVWAVRRWKLAKRCARGMCPSCGYDLRATPE